MPRRLQLDQALGHAAADKRLEILRRVADCGSISQAARAAGVSYKAAWQALDMLSNLAGVPLVQRVVGGAGGGGARLTVAGSQLLQAAQAMARSREQVLASLGARSRAQPLAALALRTSMRNQLPCTVAQVQRSGPLARVVLALEGAELACRITAESAELLGLATGRSVIALCKATAVQVQRAGAAASVAGLNVLGARASRITRGAAGDEIAARLPGGQSLVGFAEPHSGLRAGSAVQMRVDEAALVVALPG